jgi:hypothetical protein
MNKIKWSVNVVLGLGGEGDATMLGSDAGLAQLLDVV